MITLGNRYCEKSTLTCNTKMFYKVINIIVERNIIIMINFESNLSPIFTTLLSHCGYMAGHRLKWVIFCRLYRNIDVACLSPSVLLYSGRVFLQSYSGTDQTGAPKVYMFNPYDLLVSWQLWFVFSIFLPKMRTNSIQFNSFV